jgi:type IV secretion system protein VirB5
MMKSRFVRIVAALAIAACSLAVQAQGIPVYDNMSVLKAVEQLAAWKKQYDQMLEQIRTSKSQLEAMTGQRNLGSIIDNIGTQSMVPDNVVAQWRLLTAREKLLTSNLGVVDGAMRTTLQRADQIRALMTQVNATRDVKAVSELNGRIQAETTLVLNDMQRVQLMQMQASANEQRIDQEYRQKLIQQLNKGPARW